MYVNVGNIHAKSGVFKDSHTKGNYEEKCEKLSSKGTEYVLIRREVMARRRGDLRLTDSEVGG